MSQAVEQRPGKPAMLKDNALEREDPRLLSKLETVNTHAGTHDIHALIPGGVQPAMPAFF